MKPIDWPGFFLSALAASGIVFGLSVVSLPALPPVVGLIVLLIGLAASLLYVRHARRAENPILDLRLFRNPVFRVAISGGSIYRIGAGAVPFLLPLLFQLGFGLTPFQSGMLTFASAFGALGLKFFASRILRAAGFRTVLMAAAMLSGCVIAANALFTQHTPHVAIIAVLVSAGFLRSLFFTSSNALVFAEIDEKEASQATAISAAMQQITMAIGVAVGGGILEAVHFLTGEPIGQPAFAVAFGIVGTISALAVLPFLSLHANAGAAVSGHRAPLGDGDARPHR